MMSQALLIVFLMLSFVTAPVFDAVACDECAEPVWSQCERALSRQAQDFAAVASHDGDPVSQSRGTVKDLCPLCANAVVGMSVMKCNALFETIQGASQPKMLAFSDPSYPINKPPQN